MSSYLDSVLSYNGHKIRQNKNWKKVENCFYFYKINVYESFIIWEIKSYLKILWGIQFHSECITNLIILTIHRIIEVCSYRMFSIRRFRISDFLILIESVWQKYPWHQTKSFIFCFMCTHFDIQNYDIYVLHNVHTITINLIHLYKQYWKSH